MSSLADAKVKSVPFSGNKADFYVWTGKFLSYCHSQSCKEVILGTEVPINDAEYVVALTDPTASKDVLKTKKANDTAMALLNLSLTDIVSQCAVQNAISEEYANGLASTAWTNLKDIYRPISVARCNELEMEFSNCVLTHNSKNPDEWFAELDFIKQQLVIDYKQKDIYTAKKIIHHILYNVKCSIYNNLLTTLRQEETTRAKEEITNGTPHPATTYVTALVEIKREFREHYALMAHLHPPSKPKGATLLINQQHDKGKPKFKKQYKLDCRTCGKKGHKSAECWSNPLNAHKRPPRKEAALTVADGNKKMCNYCKRPGHLEETCWKKAKDGKGKGGSSKESAAAMLISIANLQFTKPSINLSSYQQDQPSPDTFIADSGATCHMRGSLNGMYNLQPYVSDIVVGSGATIKSVSKGDYKGIVVKPDGKTLDVILTDVLYIPDLWVNLISITKAISNPNVRIKLNSLK